MKHEEQNTVPFVQPIKKLLEAAQQMARYSSGCQNGNSGQGLSSLWDEIANSTEIVCLRSEWFTANHMCKLRLNSQLSDPDLASKMRPHAQLLAAQILPSPLRHFSPRANKWVGAPSRRGAIRGFYEEESCGNRSRFVSFGLVFSCIDHTLPQFRTSLLRLRLSGIRVGEQ